MCKKIELSIKLIEIQLRDSSIYNIKRCHDLYIYKQKLKKILDESKRQSSTASS